MEHGLFEIHHLRRVGELASKGRHLVVQQFQTFDLDRRPRKPVEHRAGLIVRVQQRLEHELNDLAIADHPAPGLDRPGLRCVEQFADDDRFFGDVPDLANEVRVGALAGTGGPAQEDQLLGEPHLVATPGGFQLSPDGPEDQLRVFDLEVDRRRGGFVDFGSHGGGSAGRGMPIIVTADGTPREVRRSGGRGGVTRAVAKKVVPQTQP